jgi:hypothetical protein
VNLWQTLRQVQALLKAQTWDGSTKVFHPSSVLIVPDLTDEQLVSLPGAVACIHDLGGEQDDEMPGLSRERVGVQIATCVPSHAWGEAALIGANRAGQASSAGRGLLELEEMVHDAVGKLVGPNGQRVQFRGRSGTQTFPIEENVLVCRKTYVFEAMTTMDRSYPPAARFVATGGSGQVAMTWGAPPSRYDTRRMILRYAAGATAPTSATAGTGVTLGGSPDGSGVTSATPALAAGTYSFALFAAYDEYGTGTDERYSAAVTRTSVVVT